MMKKCILVLFIALSLIVSGCDKKNPYNKYWKIFPTDEQYKECFGDDYYCVYNEDSKDEYDEESFEEVCVSDNTVGMSYYCLNDNNYSREITLEMAEDYDDLSKSTKSWLGDFDDECKLVSNDYYSLYYLCYDYDSDDSTHTISGLYGKLYYEDFEIYYEIIHYNYTYPDILNHLDNTTDYLDQLYDLIDTNRIESNL